MNRYAVRFLNRQAEIETTDTPEEFLSLTRQMHNVFALPRFEGYQVWRDNDGLWEPLHGVKDPMYVLFAEMIQDMQSEVDNSEEIGKAIVENYKRWSKEVGDIERSGARRKLDAELLKVLKERMEIIHKALRDLKADLKDVNVFEIFTYLTTEQKMSVAQKELAMHASRTTVWRQENLFLKLLGLWVLNRIHGDQLDNLIYSDENQHENGTTTPSQQDTIEKEKPVRNEVL